MNNNLLSTITIPTMSSLEIAELTGKQHKHVLEDIRRILEEAEIDSAGFTAQYNDASGKSNPCYHLPRYECDLVMTSYSVKYRAAIIKRWHELEAQIQLPQPVETIALPSPEEQAYKLFPMALEASKALGGILGFDNNSIVLDANKAVIADTNINMLEKLGHTYLLAPAQELLLTSSEIGEKLNRTAREVNNLLEKMGYQSKVRNRWMPTKKGKPYTRVLDTGKKYSPKGQMISTFKWLETVVAHIEEYISQPDDEGEYIRDHFLN